MSDAGAKEISSSGSSTPVEDIVLVCPPVPSNAPVVEIVEATEAGEREPCKTCRCSTSCACRHPLEFPRRVVALPPVRAAAALYARAKASHASVACALTTAEVAALLAAAPARLAARPLRGALATPVYVVDLLLCKGLDIAQRVLPCIAQAPSKTCRDLAFCTCMLPAGVCFMASKALCKGARTCLCDVPAVALGAPALSCCALAELCLCAAPREVCRPPVQVAGKAAHGALRDAQSILRDVNFAADRCAAGLNSQ